MNVSQWLYKRSLFSPEKIAIIFNEKILTYLELNQRVNRLSQALLKLGLQPGDRVGIISRNNLEFLEVYFACAKTGLIFVPLNFRLAPPELAFQLMDSGLLVLFVDPEQQSLIEQSLPLLSGDNPLLIFFGQPSSSGSTFYEALIQDHTVQEPASSEETVSRDAAQMIMYTSGTTGRPKGVLLSHQKTLFNTLNAQIFFDLCAQDTMLVVMPLFHSGALNIMSIPTLYAGGTIILRPRFIPQEFLGLIEQHKVTQSLLVPSMLKTLLKEARPENHDLTSLRTLLVGGEPVSPDLMHQALDLGLPVRQIFGQTESSILLWVPSEKAREKAGAGGLPVFHGEVKVVNPEGQRVSPGEIGEIIVKGPIQMMGYWNAPEETRKIIKAGWLYTGDLGRIDEEGFVYVVDRKKDMYISGGENVYPAEVERALLTHPKIREAAVIGIPDEKWGSVGKAFLCLNKAETLNYEELVLFLKGRIASYKIPKSMEVFDELPKTASGKIKKKNLTKDI
jgi:fatty-acyl-CoA synthase